LSGAAKCSEAAIGRTGTPVYQSSPEFWKFLGWLQGHGAIVGTKMQSSVRTQAATGRCGGGKTGLMHSAGSVVRHFGPNAGKYYSRGPVRPAEGLCVRRHAG